MIGITLEWGAGGERQDECGSSTLGVGHGDVAPENARELTTDRESKARSRAPVWGLLRVEGCENLIALRHGNTGPGVRNADVHCPICERGERTSDRAILRGPAQRILEKVVEDLTDTLMVGHNRYVVLNGCLE